MIERPVYFPCADDTLFGILSLPDHQTDSLVLVAGGGGPNAATFQRNGVATRLARRLTEIGIGVLRFDYHGVGDSTGEIDEFHLEKPLRKDVEAAASWARVEGFSRVGLLGICFGSRTALSVLDGGQKVSAFVLVTMPLADAVEKAVIATRQLARRQLTWLRAEPGAEWFDAFDSGTPERIAARVAEWMQKR